MHIFWKRWDPAYLTTLNLQQSTHSETGNLYSDTCGKETDTKEINPFISIVSFLALQVCLDLSFHLKWFLDITVSGYLLVLSNRQLY